MGKITIYSQACNEIAGFRSMSEEFTRKLVINGKSKSTYQNYLRQLAKLSLYYGRLPLELDTDQVEEYLYYLIQKGSDCKSSFKHTVYGLRKLYMLMDREDLQVALPCISGSNKLPVVLSTKEVIRLLKAPKHLSQKVLFGLIYDTGLRIEELTSLLIGDVDLDRCQVHVRQSKYKKDRYISMSEHAVRGIRKHLALAGPRLYLFESSVRKGNPISKTKIRNLLKDAVEKAGIKKQVCVHTLRHTYATHQLEAGQNIMTLKESMGHSDIQATLVYLHIAQLDNVKKFGCMEKLYSKNNE